MPSAADSAERPGLRHAVASVRVRYPETDRMNVAYHAHYLVWFELGRTELMRGIGCDYGTLEDRDGVFFPLVEIGARYHAPARYDDRLEIQTRLVSVGAATVRFEYRIDREGEDRALASGFTEHACVGRTGRPMRLPTGLRERLCGPEEGA